MELVISPIHAISHADVKPMEMFHGLNIVRNLSIYCEHTSDEETMKIFHRLDIAEDESH